MEKPIFVKLPTHLEFYKRDEEMDKECRECQKKAELTGMSMDELCPDADCFDDEDITLDREPDKTTEIVEYHLFRGECEVIFFHEVDEERVFISFRDTSSGTYDFSLEDFLESIKDQIVIL